MYFLMNYNWCSWIHFRDLLVFLACQGSKAPEVFQDLMVEKVKKENLPMLVYFQKDRKENQEQMEWEDLLDHQEVRENPVILDRKGKEVLWYVVMF